MIETRAFITADGKIFTSRALAVKHTEARYADALLSLAREICQIGKYRDAAEYIDQNLPRFAALEALKADIQVSAEED
jgi:hypothetical protein